MLKIITDSTADIPNEWTAGFDLQVLPLVVTIDDQSYLDGMEISLDFLYKLMGEGHTPHTSQIPYDYTRTVFEQCCKDGNDFIYISFSGAMSGCFALANMIINELKVEYPKIKMKVIDSESASTGIGLMVIQALEMAASGGTMKEVGAALEFMVAHMEQIFFVSDLGALVRKDLMGRATAIGYKAIGMKPWLKISEGEMEISGRVRGEIEMLNTIANESISIAQKFPDQVIMISHADDEPKAIKVERKIRQRMPECRTTICRIGAGLGSHLGQGGVGVFLLNKRMENYQI